MELFILLVFVFGGSFLNVLISRYPKMIEGQWQEALKEEGYIKEVDPKYQVDLNYPPSNCYHCGERIPWYRLIPLVGYLLNFGRSSCCGQPIPVRYILVEMVSILSSFAVYFLYGFTVETVILLASLFVLLSLFYIDYEEMYLPDSLVVSFGLMGLVYVDLTGSAEIVSETIFYCALFYFGSSLLVSLYEKCRGVGEMLGRGDIKLLTAMFVYMSFEEFGWVLLSASLVHIAINYSQPKEVKPFGPWIILSFVGCMAYKHMDSLVIF
ncbi:prepilin peptidase [Vibrio barjaei]|uniref:prepilin peptidase n=1 Tax=Vibrio barjaei TaxID=1676683 RepID=UPI002283A981|nr:A24 family peptidase [Vibrio barjaei]MCY9872363.1 prepilin peptidase [Vibrio barjaei]